MKWEPIIPFEPVMSDEIPDGKEWIHQVKWDGVRVLAYFEGTETRLFNRHGNERTAVFPEIARAQNYLSALSAIVDGEVIALDTSGKPSFHEVMRRDGISRMEKIPVLRREVPITYMIFDLIYRDGEWIDQVPLERRCDMLSDVLIETGQVRRVTSEEDGFALYQAVKQQGMEGIVSKNLNSKYLIKGKNGSWKKIKTERDLIAVIGGVTRRSSRFNALMLGLYNRQGQLVYIGRAGPGRLSEQQWQIFTNHVGLIKTSVCPFSNPPEAIKDVQWLKPDLTVKVVYREWTRGGNLRQPVIQAITGHQAAAGLFEDESHE